MKKMRKLEVEKGISKIVSFVVASTHTTLPALAATYATTAKIEPQDGSILLHPPPVDQSKILPAASELLGPSHHQGGQLISMPNSHQLTVNGKRTDCYMKTNDNLRAGGLMPGQQILIQQNGTTTVTQIYNPTNAQIRLNALQASQSGAQQQQIVQQQQHRGVVHVLLHVVEDLHFNRRRQRFDVTCRSRQQSHRTNVQHTTTVAKWRHCCHLQSTARQQSSRCIAGAKRRRVER